MALKEFSNLSTNEQEYYMDKALDICDVITKYNTCFVENKRIIRAIAEEIFEIVENN